jgi:hypothetical protein
VLTADTTVTWSLRRHSNARLSPYRGDALAAGATKARAGRPGLDLDALGSNPERVCRFPYRPSRVPGRNRTGCLPGTSWLICQVSYKGIVSAAQFEGALPTSSRWCLLPLGYEDIEPLPRLERVLRLTGSALWPDELQRHKLGNLGSNQEPLDPESSALPIAPFPMGTDGEIRTLRRAGMPSPITPTQCATWDLNPEFPD